MKEISIDRFLDGIQMSTSTIKDATGVAFNTATGSASEYRAIPVNSVPSGSPYQALYNLGILNAKIKACQTSLQTERPLQLRRRNQVRCAPAKTRLTPRRKRFSPTKAGTAPLKGAMPIISACLMPCLQTARVTARMQWSRVLFYFSS